MDVNLHWLLIGVHRTERGSAGSLSQLRVMMSPDYFRVDLSIRRYRARFRNDLRPLGSPFQTHLYLALRLLTPAL